MECRLKSCAKSAAFLFGEDSYFVCRIAGDPTFSSFLSREASQHFLPNSMSSVWQSHGANSNCNEMVVMRDTRKSARAKPPLCKHDHQPFTISYSRSLLVTVSDGAALWSHLALSPESAITLSSHSYHISVIYRL